MPTCKEISDKCYTCTEDCAIFYTLPSPDAVDSRNLTIEAERPKPQPLTLRSRSTSINYPRRSLTGNVPAGIPEKEVR